MHMVRWNLCRRWGVEYILWQLLLSIGRPACLFGVQNGGESVKSVSIESFADVCRRPVASINCTENSNKLEECLLCMLCHECTLPSSAFVFLLTYHVWCDNGMSICHCGAYLLVFLDAWLLISLDQRIFTCSVISVCLAIPHYSLCPLSSSSSHLSFVDFLIHSVDGASKHPPRKTAGLWWGRIDDSNPLHFNNCITV